MQNLGTDYHRTFSIVCGIYRMNVRNFRFRESVDELLKPRMVETLKAELVRLRIIRELIQHQTHKGDNNDSYRFPTTHTGGKSTSGL